MHPSSFLHLGKYYDGQPGRKFVSLVYRETVAVIGLVLREGPTRILRMQRIQELLVICPQVTTVNQIKHLG
jgi:hypothetical protein